MTAQLDALSFDGEPFDALLWSTPESLPPAPDPQQPTPADLEPLSTQDSRPAPAEHPPTPSTSPGADPVAELLGDVRAELVAAHLSAMDVQTAWQRRTLAALGQPATDKKPVTGQTYRVAAGYSPDSGITVAAQPGPASAMPEVRPATTMSAFKALALTTVTTLDATALASLVRGEIAAVFGPAYEQHGDNPAIRLTPTTHARLTRIAEITRHGGPWHRGRLRAEYEGPLDPTAVVELAWQAAQVFALQVGLHLCLAQARFHTGPDQSEVDLTRNATGPGELLLDVVQLDLLPRPWLRVNAELRHAGEVVARVRGLVLEIREAPGTPVGPAVGGVITTSFGRYSSTGERALLGELHMTHSARGDLGIALGPEFTAYAGRRATRMPNHGLQLCDRVMAVEGERGNLTAATSRTEYDSPADSWYYAETANASIPNVVYMETSLQSALLLGYFLGATLTAPEEDYSLRNLDGTATVLREVDLRDKTIHQTTRLLTTTVMVGAVLQSFSYELSVDGEPFYAGESLFGFFNETALANQNGLDNGAYVPPWQPSTPARTLDVAARRKKNNGVRSTSGHLALLDTVEVVDGGGKFGRGYLRAARPVAADDWFFAYHFHLDPVMPGSFGVEAVLQAVQEWALDAGLADGLTDPEFVVPAEVALSWRYRGQILADDREMTLEVHIEDVQRRPGRVRVIGEASVWKPGLRIYELTGVAVELRGADARPW
ncbi:beta-ketoacyl synthase [Amycolatopsis sp. NPDC005232]|uniref:beta-ketoacyl synthase n=1 Tax=Amycolatopsis sp. NPDC005232 TaxID=3157027 RepID=UPI0033AA3E20